MADVWVRLSKCCTPVPGDEIQGFVTHGHGVSVHRANCVNLEHLSDTQRERMVPVHWAPTRRLGLPGRDPGRGPRPHPAAVRRHPGPVRPARQHPVSASVQTTRDRVALSRFTFEMGDPKHLGDVLRAVRNIDGVYDVYRVTN